MLPTLITDAPERTGEAVDAVRAARAVPGRGILGLHLEGPFISPARPGIHPASFIRRMVRADCEALVAAKAGLGVLLVTLAPEEVEDEDLATLAEAGVVLAAGHTVAGPRRLGGGETGRAARLHASVERDAACCRPCAGAGRGVPGR